MKGIIDVTKPPYNLPDNYTGKTNIEIQRALNAAGYSLCILDNDQATCIKTYGKEASIDSKDIGIVTVVYLPPGEYTFNDGIKIPKGVTLEGSARFPQAWEPRTLILVKYGHGDKNGHPLISLEGKNSGIRNLAIHYPDQEAQDIQPYPWTIRGGPRNEVNSDENNDNMCIENLLLLNPYNAIDFASNPCGRHYINKVYGTPLNTGIVIDQCADVGRISDIHFWTIFWSLNKDEKDSVCKYIKNNAKALILRQTDWQIVHNFFAHGYHIGISLERNYIKDKEGKYIRHPETGDIQSKGDASGQLSNINIDDADIGINVEYIQRAGVLISNLNIACKDTYGVKNRKAIIGRYRIGQEITQDNKEPPFHNQSRLVINNASFWGNFSNETILWDNEGLLSLSSSIFNNQEQGVTEKYICIKRGRVIIQGCYFDDANAPGQTKIDIGKNVDRAVIVGNDFIGNQVSVNSDYKINNQYLNLT